MKTLTAKLSLDGPFWAGRGWPAVYADRTVTPDAQREHITFYSPAARNASATCPWRRAGLSRISATDLS